MKLSYKSVNSCKSFNSCNSCNTKVTKGTEVTIQKLQKMKLFTLLKLFTLIFISCTLSYAAGEKIVVSVNGVNITEAEVQMTVENLMRQKLYHGPTNEKREQLRKPAIDYVIERELLYQEAKRLGLSMKKSEIKEVFSKDKESFKNKKAFNNALKKQGLTEEGYKKIIEEELLSREFLKQEVEEKINLSEGDLEDYYNKNKGKFLIPSKMRLREILISIPSEATEEEGMERKKKAQELFDRLRAGEDFSEVAYNYSEDAYRVKGGDLGFVHKGRLLPELDDAAMKLEVGEMSGLIETTSGFHIIKLEEKTPEKQLSFSEAKDSLKKELETKKHKELKETLINRLKEKAVIKIQE